MMQMIINATQKEELRVALVNKQVLIDLDIERLGREQKKANIYKGRITRIEPSLEAVFVDYGAERNGFLPLKEISPEYFRTVAPTDGSSRASIKELLQENQEIMVQVVKEERGSKGAALTTYITLAGCYLVLMPNNPDAGGISRRIDDEDRDTLRDILSQIQVPEGMGMIVRTAGVGRSIEELEWDLNILLSLWEAIKQAYQGRPAPFLIHQESDVITRSIRDHLRQELNEILVDDHDIFVKVRDYVQQIRPDFIHKIKLYQDTIPAFTRFQIESQIESAFQREVRLPSGGVIVIDHTEALVSIDINSGKDTTGSGIETTALNTNLEAAEEISRQLRLRDIGGLIVIDFIDMEEQKNQREVENRLRNSLRIDRARVQIGKISRFGLLEMSRQRLRPALGEAIQVKCPRCDGRGNIRSVESLSLSIIRMVEEQAMKSNTAQIHVQVPIEIATYLLNEKRYNIENIEQRNKLNIFIIPNKYLEVPHYQIKRLRTEEVGQYIPRSYQSVTAPEEEFKPSAQTIAEPEEPAVKTSMLAHAPAPSTEIFSKQSNSGLVKRLWEKLFGKKLTESKSLASSSETESPDKERDKKQQHKPYYRKKSHHRHRSGGFRSRRGGKGRNKHHHKSTTPST